MISSQLTTGVGKLTGDNMFLISDIIFPTIIK
jgi:hypothetical protein